MPTYRCVMVNEQGWRLTWFPSDDGFEQPYEAALREVNSHPDHSKYGPWVVFSTDRHS